MSSRCPILGDGLRERQRSIAGRSEVSRVSCCTAHSFHNSSASSTSGSLIVLQEVLHAASRSTKQIKYAQRRSFVSILMSRKMATIHHVVACGLQAAALVLVVQICSLGPCTATISTLPVYLTGSMEDPNATRSAQNWDTCRPADRSRCREILFLRPAAADDTAVCQVSQSCKTDIEPFMYLC